MIAPATCPPLGPEDFFGATEGLGVGVGERVGAIVGSLVGTAEGIREVGATVGD